MAKYRFQPTLTGYKVFYRGRSIGSILPMRESTGRHCFYLGWDRRRAPRTYRGKTKAAEALHAIHQLVNEARAKQWSTEQLVVHAWDQRPTASRQW